MTNYYKKGNRLLWFLIFSLWSVFSFGQQATFRQGVKQGSVKVKFSGQLTQTLRKMNVTQGKKLLTGIQAFDKVSAKVGAKKMHRLFPENPNPRLEAKLRKHKLDLWYVVDIDANQKPQDVVLQYKRINEIEVAETEKEKVLSEYSYTQISSTQMSTVKSSAAAPYFNDPKLGDQWHYENTGQTGYPGGSDVNLFKAWDVVKGNPQVIVSIHDQGVDIEHPDLKANIWTNQAELNGEAGKDDDGNGYIDDIHGWNFDKKSGAIEAQFHGTHVAGTIAAVNNNGIGVCGVAGGSGNNDGSKVMSLQCLGGGGFEQSYIYAADNGAVISQNSWGYTGEGNFDQSVADAIDYFIAEAGDYPNSPMKGGIVIFAAGNSNSDGDWYPGRYDHTLSVSSIGPNWEKASYSNYGTWVNIAAPGGESDLGSKNGVLSTLPKNQYGYSQGTSMACPHVSGIAALALANRKSQLTPELLRIKLLTGVVDIDSHNPGYEGKLGSGHIDAFLAIQNDQGIAPATIADLTVTGVAQEFANLSWTIPSDVDDVQPTEFRVYYSTSPITKNNLSAAQYVTIKSSALAGTTMTYTVNGLLGLTPYYFAVISKDRWNNLSELSNVGQGTTNAGPKIDVDANSKDIVINVDASTSFKGTHDLTILNNAEGALRWEFSTRHKQTSISSFAAKQINYPVAKATKVASLGNVRKIKARVSSASSSKEVGTFQFTPTQKTYCDGPTDVIGEEDIKLPNSAATKYVVNEADGFNLTQIQTYLNVNPAFGPVVVEVYKGTELDKKNLIYAQEYTPWSADQNYADITLDEQLYFQQGETFWVVLHVPAGNLYPLSIGYENTPEGSDNCFISFDLGQTWGSLGVALEDSNFAWFNIANSQNKYLGEYLTLDPKNGEVNGNSTEKTILSADGSALINGTYSANAIFKSNDATNTEFKVPVTVNVTGQQPILKSIETLDFASVFKGTSKEIEFVVKNTGLGNFNDVSYTISNPNFELVDGAPYQITADGQVLLKVKYTPNALGNDNGVLTFSSTSSPKTLKIVLFGVSTEPAKIVVTPMTQLINNVTLGNQVTASVTVKNGGKAALKYFIPNYDKSGTSDNWVGKYHKYGYKYRTSYASETAPLAYQFQDISTTGTDITKYFKADGNRYFPVEMGFDFPYYANKMQTLYISYKGFTTFDDTVAPINTPSLSNSGSPKGYISPLGTFIELALGGSVQYKVEADKVIVQFTNVTDGYAGYLTAQMVLYADGNIRFYYDNVTFSEQDVQYLNVLIEDFDQKDGILVNDYSKVVKIYSKLALGFDYPGPDMITSISNAGGILLPGESAKMDVVMETAALHEGMINRYLNIISTDPVNAQVNPLIQVNITKGGKAKLDVSHTDINFGEVFQGAVASRKFNIKNNGTASVKLTSFTLDNNKFQITGDKTATIAPGLSTVYEVTMPTNVVASLADVLRITDSKGVKYVLTLSGKVMDPPAIKVTNLDLITQVLNHGETAKYPILIENTGIADLEVVATGTDWLTMSVPVSTAEAIPNFTYNYETYNDGTNYQWIDIRKTGTQLPFPDDYFDVDLYWKKVTLPWAVNFYGKEYTDVNVGTTGLLTFDKPEANAVFNDRIPTDLFKTLIAPYWTFGGFNLNDFKKEDIGIFYYSDQDKIIISWEYFVNNFGNGDPISAQVIFYKNGTMKFQYKMNGTLDLTTKSTVIGLQNGDGSDFVAISNNANVNHGSGLAYVISPAKKQVIPAGTTLSAQINIDARNIYAGEYDGKLKLRTNVPNQEQLEKPIHLTVKGSPEITSNVTEINYGEIMLIPAVTSTKEFEIKNSGAATLQLSNISIESGSAEYKIEIYAYFTNWWGEGFWDWANINDLGGVYSPILPGDMTKFRITYAPTAAGSVSDNIVIESNATVAQMMIPIKADVTLPPALNVETTEVNSVVNYLTDKDTQFAVFNNGTDGGTLKYELSIDYLRKSISGFSSHSQSIAKTGKTANLNLLKSIPAPKGGISLYAADPSFNRVLAYEDSNKATARFFGYGGGLPFTTATRFNAGKDGFTLSHFKTFMNGTEKPSGTIVYEIRAGGSSVNDATIIDQGSVDYVYAGDKAGAWVTLPIKEPKGLYPNEDFYIVLTYPYEISYSQGAIDKLDKTPGRYTAADTEGEFSDIQDVPGFQDIGWMVRAGEENYLPNAWVTMNGLSNGDLAPGETRKVQLDFTAANGVRGDQHAILNIRTNDPVNIVGKVPVNLHINEAPIFSNIPEDAIIVNEASEVVVNVRLKDKEANTITVKAPNVPKWVTFELIDQEIAIKLAPGYETAGTYTLKYTATDNLGAATEMTLQVEVLKTNRAPLAIQSEELIYSRLKYFDVRQFADYFSDPDDDKMTFTASVANTDIVSVTTGQDLGEYVIETHAAGETILTLTATDVFGASTEQQIKVIVNKAEITELNIFPNPVVNTMNIKWEDRWAGDVVVEIVALNGATVRRYEIKDVQLKGYSELDLSTLPIGVYFLHVSGKEGTSSVIKFIKRSQQ
jgi:subtilisin family serine protease